VLVAHYYEIIKGIEIIEFIAYIILICQVFWRMEMNYMRGKCIMEPLEEISKSKLIKYKVKFSKVTNTTPMQKKYFNMIGIRNPMSLEKFVW